MKYFIVKTKGRENIQNKKQAVINFLILLIYLFVISKYQLNANYWILNINPNLRLLLYPNVKSIYVT